MCKACETKPVYEFTNQRKLCKRCYVQWFEKKFLYTIRKFEMIEKGDKVFISNSKDITTRVLRDRIENYAQRGTIKIVRTKGNAKVLSFKTADELGLDSFPTTFVIGKDGKVIHYQPGFTQGEGSTETKPSEGEETA